MNTGIIIPHFYSSHFLVAYIHHLPRTYCTVLQRSSYFQLQYSHFVYITTQYSIDCVFGWCRTYTTKSSRPGTVPVDSSQASPVAVIF